MTKKFFIFTIIILLILLLSIAFLSKRETNELQIIKGMEGNVKNYAIFTEEGDVLYTDSTLDMRTTILNNIVVKADAFKVKNPIGIVENPPNKSITDVRDMVIESLDNNNDVLIIYIDGLGFELYEKAILEGYLSYISLLNKGDKALTVYPSITDVTFASMVTGATPKFTGIHGREKSLLTVDTMFDLALQRGKTSKIIEGNIRIINDEVETILNIDDNKNGTIDDEIFEAAMNELKASPDILLVHFHSYDDMGHEFGPNSENALAQLKVLDSYVEELLKAFNGDVIITSDHGMHDVENGGSHGTFSSSDMFIPIIIKKDN